MGNYYAEIGQIARALDKGDVAIVTAVLDDVRKRCGRVFCLGVGGSAANASHLVNDLRKLCGIEAYAPTDNSAELTARTNDDGWDSVFVEWLKVSKLSPSDAIFVLSVGGGSKEKNVSVGLVHAIDHAKKVGASILGIVGRDGGYLGKQANCCVIIPTVNEDYVTPHTEAFQAVVWHDIVWRLKIKEGKWESLKK